MVLQLCDGVAASDVASRVAASRLRSLSLPLGDQSHRRVGCHRGHFARPPLLPFHSCCRNSLGELSLPNPWITCPSLPGVKSPGNRSFSCWESLQCVHSRRKPNEYME